MMSFNDFDQAEYGAFWNTLNAMENGGHTFDIDNYARPNGKTIKQCQANKTVQLGDSGDEVKELQTLLGVVGHPVTVSGTFDDATDSAVRAFQVKKKLSASGVVDAGTWKKLCNTAYGINPEALASVAAVGVDILGMFGFGKKPKGKKGKGGGEDTGYVAPGPNLFLWIGVPVVLAAVGTGIYLATRTKAE
jgi:peptidoglycan hydrolase-like protein with peptidoglycan-binding domain